ncbi:RidA family protein [Roseomonas terrae]|jgi:2-iminobutanoate/2-iminopropanoate deaminase|uniref:RidA family protein n=1 Tax=Neoroseomonas terrae TaxID=424799 RepID=A0ABS5EJN4_9PROT|nr:RidA family protein [Neoroseomonas terrae]MBR0651236.1 RidA family protein [Neoroseomonas terrae]
MPIITHDAPDAPPTLGGYAQAAEVVAPARLLFVSGQVPLLADGSRPEGFAAQCRQAWANLEAQLRVAGMGLDNLVKVTTFLAQREDAAENRAIRNEVLAGRRVALTVILPAIFDEAWLIEIEAVAAA